MSSDSSGSWIDQEPFRQPHITESDPLVTPNLFLTYVTDVDRSTKIYSQLFDMQPTMLTPRYVSFEVAPEVLFALWTGKADHVGPGVPRTSEVGLMIAGGGAAIDEMYTRWREFEVIVVEEPHDDVFGRTFVVADRDGNLIRVSPID